MRILVGILLGPQDVEHFILPKTKRIYNVYKVEEAYLSVLGFAHFCAIYPRHLVQLYFLFCHFAIRRHLVKETLYFSKEDYCNIYQHHHFRLRQLSN